MKKGGDIEIETKNINKARKNLSHWKEPEETKVPKLFPVSLKIAIETSEAIFTAGVKLKEAVLLYQEVYQPKVEYPLGQTSFTEKQLKKRELASLPRIITKYVYNRNMTTDVQGGPTRTF